MHKVITINLNGRAYQLEEDGYEALRHYLDQASAQLENNPDRNEIMTDFEQAIADKCQRFLSDYKTVITLAEITQIIQEMGPVEGFQNSEKNDSQAKKESSESSQHQSHTSSTPKRLYLIHEGAFFTGVCNGLAAYFQLDVTLVRVIFVGLTILTHGAWILVYIIMSIIIPYANTAEEKAAARGLPFNAQELLRRARAKYADFDKQSWHDKKKYWYSQKHYWKQQAREYSQQWKTAWHQHQPDLQQNFQRSRSGIALAIMAILMAFISLFWVMGIVSLLSTGALFGFVLVGFPLWLTIVLLTCAYNILLMPVRMLRAAVHPQGNYADNGWFGILDTIMWFTLIGFFFWLMWVYIPPVHGVWNSVATWFQTHFGK